MTFKLQTSMWEDVQHLWSSDKCTSKSPGITPHPLGWLLEKKETRKCVGENVEKLEPLYPFSGKVKWCSNGENSMEVSQKIKYRIMISFTNPTSGHTSQRTESRILKRYICTPRCTAASRTTAKRWSKPNVHLRWTDGQNGGYMCTGIPLSLKKQGHSDTCCNMDEP